MGVQYVKFVEKLIVDKMEEEEKEFKDLTEEEQEALLEKAKQAHFDKILGQSIKADLKSKGQKKLRNLMRQFTPKKKKRK